MAPYKTEADRKAFLDRAIAAFTAQGNRALVEKANALREHPTT